MRSRQTKTGSRRFATLLLALIALRRRGHDRLPLRGRQDSLLAKVVREVRCETHDTNYPWFFTPTPHWSIRSCSVQPLVNCRFGTPVSVGGITTVGPSADAEHLSSESSRPSTSLSGNQDDRNDQRPPDRQALPAQVNRSPRIRRADLQVAGPRSPRPSLAITFAYVT